MRIVFASHNNNKVSEIKPLFPKGVEVVTLNQLGLTNEIPETEPTIEGNALLKARYVYERLHIDCFADDTGLEIEALDGRPGVYSARYAGEGKSAADNIVKILAELDGVKERHACFRTVIVAIVEGKEHFFEGKVDGIIAIKPAGNNGFGYDPVFVPDGYDISFAQMTLEEKNGLSHRSKAVNKFIKFLEEIA